MGVSRAGHHGDWVYVFEDAGYDSTPNDTTQKTLGSSVVVDDLGADYQAVRHYNASRTAAEIIRQNFDGAWGATFNINTPPWWLAGIYGQPTSSNISGNLHQFDYDLANDNDPVSLRFYAPTDGFSNYEMFAGAVIVSCTIDQSDNAAPEVSLAGGYARDPVNQASPSLTIPSLPETTFSNRDAELIVDSTTAAKMQNTSLTLETGTQLISEIGTANQVDYIPGAFTPDISYEKIVATDESVDLLQRFRDGNQVTVELNWDNGLTGDDEYTVEFDVTNALTNQYNETGRNDPEATLNEELSDMAQDATALFTTSEGSGNPPGITL